MSLFSNSKKRFCINILIPYVEIVYKKRFGQTFWHTWQGTWRPAFFMHFFVRSQEFSHFIAMSIKSFMHCHKMSDSSIFQKFGTFLFFYKPHRFTPSTKVFVFWSFIPSLFHAVLFPNQINDNVLFLNVCKGKHKFCNIQAQNLKRTSVNFKVRNANFKRAKKKRCREATLRFL